MKENKLLELYFELKSKVLEEGKIILLEGFEGKRLNKLIMEKRIIRDKVEKLLKKNPNVIDNINEKEKVKIVIKELLILEEKNREIYTKNMKKLQSRMGNLKTERKLKNTYTQSKPISRLWDEKK